jgi:3-deoxy-D-manno-octulosonate 8-phosphate phosphatase (KDO 8-P phosphatase)
VGIERQNQGAREIRRIRVFFIDVDGTLTDGQIHLSTNGELFKSFNVRDGWGIKQLMANEITPVVISGRNSKITALRCQELGITDIYQGVDDKMVIVEEVMANLKAEFDEIASIGDDLIDWELLMRSRLAFVPHDCHRSLKTIKAVHILDADGGKGAVREAVDAILAFNGVDILSPGER